LLNPCGRASARVLASLAASKHDELEAEALVDARICAAAEDLRESQPAGQLPASSLSPFLSSRRLVVLRAGSRSDWEQESCRDFRISTEAEAAFGPGSGDEQVSGRADPRVLHCYGCDTRRQARSMASRSFHRDSQTSVIERGLWKPPEECQ
jgi:hypothetical protein